MVGEYRYNTDTDKIRITYGLFWFFGGHFLSDSQIIGQKQDSRHHLPFLCELYFQIVTNLAFSPSERDISCLKWYSASQRNKKTCWFYGRNLHALLKYLKPTSLQ